MIDVVYARGSEWVLPPSGIQVQVLKGSHWPADDPVVRLRPDLFTSDSRYGLSYSQPPQGYGADLEPLPQVEEATANPGERRSVRRPQGVDR